MRQFQPELGRLLLVAVLITGAGTSGSACAQEDDAEREQAVAVVNANQRLEGMRVNVDAQVVREIGVQGIKPGDLLETLLLRRVKSLASERHLTVAQANKLRLAGRADIKHFVDRLDQIARTGAQLRNDRDELRNFTHAIQEASNEVRSGFFVKDSLFWKTLARMLDAKPERDPAQSSIEKDRIGDDQSQSRRAALEADEEKARQELRHLTSNILFKRAFDQWVSDTLGAGAARRERLESFLSAGLTELWAECYLTDEQKNKLQSAGRADISRFLERLEQFEKRFEGRRGFEVDFPVREAEALKSSYWRAFGDDSALAAALVATLSKEQLAWHERGNATRNLVRYQSAIHEAAASLARTVRMNVEQARTLEDLLRKETRPPRKFGQFSQTQGRGSGDFDTTLVLCQAATISEAKLKAAFGDDLCDKLTRRLAWRRNAYVEAELKRHGFVLVDRPAGVRPAPVVTNTKSGNQ